MSSKWLYSFLASGLQILIAWTRCGTKSNLTEEEFIYLTIWGEALEHELTHELVTCRGEAESHECFRIQSRSLLLSSPSLERHTQRGVSMVILNPVKWTATMNHHSLEETRAKSQSLSWQEHVNGISEPAPTPLRNTHFPHCPLKLFSVVGCTFLCSCAEALLTSQVFFPQS